MRGVAASNQKLAEKEKGTAKKTPSRNRAQEEGKRRDKAETWQKKIAGANVAQKRQNIKRKGRQVHR
jgi:hypothetical protein